jgi:hypothetical protein
MLGGSREFDASFNIEARNAGRGIPSSELVGSALARQTNATTIAHRALIVQDEKL